MHWLIFVSIALLIFAVYVYTRQSEYYAAPRDENTMPPFTESVGNQYMTSNNSPYVEATGTTVIDNQTEIYKDMGGLDYQIQASNPILNFIKGDPSTGVVYGDFVPNESVGGSASMYPIQDEMIAEGDFVSNTSNLVAVPENPTIMKNVYGVDVNGNIFGSGVEKSVTTDQERDFLLAPDNGQYIPELTSPTIPFLGKTLSSSKSQASEISQEESQ
jgi:hypothetical protein